TRSARRVLTGKERKRRIVNDVIFGRDEIEPVHDHVAVDAASQARPCVIAEREAPALFIGRVALQKKRHDASAIFAFDDLKLFLPVGERHEVAVAYRPLNGGDSEGGKENADESECEKTSP